MHGGALKAGKYCGKGNIILEEFRELCIISLALLP